MYEVNYKIITIGDGRTYDAAVMAHAWCIQITKHNQKDKTNMIDIIL